MSYVNPRWSKQLIKDRAFWIGKRVSYIRLDIACRGVNPGDWLRHQETGTVVDCQDTGKENDSDQRYKHKFTGYVIVQRDGTNDHRGEDLVSTAVKTTVILEPAPAGVEGGAE